MIYKKSDFYNDINSGRISPETKLVTYFPKVTGALCNVSVVDGIPVFKNHQSTFLNTALAKYIVDCGIEGDVIIHHPSLSRNVPRWLTYKLDNEPLEQWGKAIEIHTLGQKPKSVGDIPIRVIEANTTAIDNIQSVIIELSRKNFRFDGLYIDAEVNNTSRRYHMIPLRYCNGKIVSYDAKEKIIVAEIVHRKNKHIVRIEVMTNTMKKALDSDKDMTGANIRIQYTSYIPGDRLKNFAAPTAIWVNDF